MGPHDDDKIQHTEIFRHRDLKIDIFVDSTYIFVYNIYTFYTYVVHRYISYLSNVFDGELALSSSNAVCFHRLLTFAACGEQVDRIRLCTVGEG